MTTKTLFTLAMLIGLGMLSGCSTLTTGLQGTRFETTPAWPLCGRITENPPSGWQAAQGCPSVRWGNPDYTDAPFSSTFGPRQKASETYRYDFHRGLDIPTPRGTPVFAIAPGVVQRTGDDPAYADALVQLRHYRPGSDRTCKDGGGCYVSNFAPR